MKLIYSLLLLNTCLLFSMVEGVSQVSPTWVKTMVGYNYFLHAVDFPAGQDSIGFLAGSSQLNQGDGIVLKSTDGGIQWIPVWNGPTKGILGASFPSVQTGFIAGVSDFSAGWSGFGKTVDGGVSWSSPVVASDILYFTDVVFKDANNGILLGASTAGGVVYVTSNGGTTWSYASGVLANIPQHACYVSGSVYFLTDDGGKIKKSTDNGLSWSVVYDLSGTILKGVEFYDDLNGLACGDNGLLIRTTDGGINWIYQVGGSHSWYDHGWLSPTHVFCCGDQELVLESTDGGVTWLNGYPTSPHEAQLFECIFTSNGTGYICGSLGTLLRRAPECTAAFIATETRICAGDDVTFQNQSTGTLTYYNWYFEGGDPSSSQNQTPSVTYNLPGTYDVQLIAGNTFWADTLVKHDYITVMPLPEAPVIWNSGDTLYSSIVSRNQWYFNGNAITGATGQQHIASLSGWYWDVVSDSECYSDTSNNVYLIVTGMQKKPVFSPRIFYSNGTISIDFQSTPIKGMLNVQIISISGVEVYREKLTTPPGGGILKIETGFLKPGVYVVVLRSGLGIHTGKLFVIIE